MEEVVDHADFSHVSSGFLLSCIYICSDRCRTVIDDSFNDEFRDGRVLEGWVSLSSNNLVFEVCLHDSHLVLSECSSLISADLVSVSHSLGSVQLLDEVVLISHGTD